MPSSLTYPGVYVEEISSGVRPITGVATSVAAFVGRTQKGPVDKPVTVTSVAEYERTFGALSVKYPVGFSVRDFYENGGSIAIVVRVFAVQENSVDSVITYPNDGGDPLTLTAKSPGSWASGLRIRIERGDATKLKELGQQLGLADGAPLFNLRTYDTTTKSELPVILNLTAEATARQISGILAADPNAPFEITLPLPAAIKEHKTPADDTEKKKLWTDSKYSTGVTTPENVKDSGDLTTSDAFGEEGDGTGFYALDHADLFNLLVMPVDEIGDDTDDKKAAQVTTRAAAAAYCRRKRAFYIVDPPKNWTTVESATHVDKLGITGPDARYAAVYFPRIKKSNPLKGNLVETFPASGMIAGIMARTDTTRGVWKAPAGVDATLNGIAGLDLDPPMTDDQNGQLNPLGVNCLRYFPIIGNVIWGARTLRGADLLGDEYKYVPVRRTANFIEESLFRGLKWVVFEPNDEPLWAQIRLNVGAFLQSLYRQGAFQGTSARDAYFVACDKTTTTQDDINHGIVNVVVGFAPLKPAEFVVLKIQQLAGQIQT